MKSVKYVLRCVKTGFDLYVKNHDGKVCHMRVDLFMANDNNLSLYSNDNIIDEITDIPIAIEDCVVCDSIETFSQDGRKYHLLINPVVGSGIIKYVDEFKHKSFVDQVFIDRYSIK